LGRGSFLLLLAFEFTHVLVALVGWLVGQLLFP
jgi:hypothetical protein